MTGRGNSGENEKSSIEQRGSVWNPEKHCERIDIFNEKHRKHKEMLSEVQSLDEELYSRFKDDLVQSAVKIMADKPNLHVFSAIQSAQRNLVDQGKYIGRQYKLLKIKIVNDTGGRINGLYVWENALGGVVGRVEKLSRRKG